MFDNKKYELRVEIFCFFPSGKKFEKKSWKEPVIVLIRWILKIEKEKGVVLKEIENKNKWNIL